MAEVYAVGIYSVFALILIIALFVLAGKVPNLLDSSATDIIGSVGITVFILGVFAFLAVSTLIPGSVDSVVYWNTFFTHAVLLPISLLSLVTAATVLADAKKTLLTSGNV